MTSKALHLGRPERLVSLDARGVPARLNGLLDSHNQIAMVLPLSRQVSMRTTLRMKPRRVDDVADRL
jgi:hypothetical protein